MTIFFLGLWKMSMETVHGICFSRAAIQSRKKDTHTLIMLIKLIIFQAIAIILTFNAPGLKGPLGASSSRIICLSLRLSVRNSVPLTNKVQYLKFG